MEEKSYKSKYGMYVQEKSKYISSMPFGIPNKSLKYIVSNLLLVILISVILYYIFEYFYESAKRENNKLVSWYLVGFFLVLLIAYILVYLSILYDTLKIFLNFLEDKHFNDNLWDLERLWYGSVVAVVFLHTLGKICYIFSDVFDINIFFLHFFVKLLFIILNIFFIFYCARIYPISLQHMLHYHMLLVAIIFLGSFLFWFCLILNFLSDFYNPIYRLLVYLQLVKASVDYVL